MNGDPASLIDRFYWFAISRNKPFRVAAGLLSRLGLAVLSSFMRFRVSSDRSLTDWQMLLGSYEKGTIALLQGSIRPGMVAVDVGAHVGFFTKHLSRLVGPGGSVISFEAHPGTYELLRSNCRKLGNVSTVNAAVTNFDGETTLYDSGGSSGSNSLVSTRSAYQGSNLVRALQLDGYLEGRVVDLVKIDVEGAELEVLEGMKETLGTSPAIWIIIEFFPPVWSEHPEGPRALLDRLEGMGLELSVIADDGSLIAIEEWPSFDDLVASVPKYVNVLATKASPSVRSEDDPG